MISRVNHHQKMSPGKCLAGDIFLMILLVAADQVAKWLSYLYLKGQLSISLIPGVLELHYLYPENRGIAFGMFQPLQTILIYKVFLSTPFLLH